MSIHKRGWVRRCILIYEQLFVNVVVFLFSLVLCPYIYVFIYVRICILMAMIVAVSTMLAFMPTTLGQNDETKEEKKIRIELSYKMKIKAQIAYKTCQSS